MLEKDAQRAMLARVGPQKEEALSAELELVSEQVHVRIGLPSQRPCFEWLPCRQSKSRASSGLVSSYSPDLCFHNN